MATRQRTVHATSLSCWALFFVRMYRADGVYEKSATIFVVRHSAGDLAGASASGDDSELRRNIELVADVREQLRQLQ